MLVCMLQQHLDAMMVGLKHIFPCWPTASLYRDFIVSDMDWRKSEGGGGGVAGGSVCV